jgi:hypothetical protein
MSASAAQIAQLRRMVAEPTDATYSDEALSGYVERYALLDERGQEPYTWDTSTTPPSKSANTEWVPTYDLNAAAAEVWDEKAAALASRFDYTADGGSFHRSQAYEHAQGRARYYRSRRSPKTATLVKWPEENAEAFGWITNRPEADD